jgi:hypothetical protein
LNRDIIGRGLSPSNFLINVIEINIFMLHL